jgi:hypothetical protein
MVTFNLSIDRCAGGGIAVRQWWDGGALSPGAYYALSVSRTAVISSNKLNDEWH